MSVGCAVAIAVMYDVAVGAEVAFDPMQLDLRVSTGRVVNATDARLSRYKIRFDHSIVLQHEALRLCESRLQRTVRLTRLGC